MEIARLSLWTQNLEGMKAFYTRHFGAEAGAVYVNDKLRFSSCALHFRGSPAIELMRRLDLLPKAKGAHIGPAHLAFDAGDVEGVHKIIKKFKQEGVKIITPQRYSGDGRFFAAVADPDGNLIEICAAAPVAPR